MDELLPVFAGVLLGVYLASLRPSKRLPVAVVGSVLLGIGASAVGGELAVAWQFVLVDIPLVAASAGAGWLVSVRGLRRPRVRAEGRRRG